MIKSCHVFLERLKQSDFDFYHSIYTDSYLMSHIGNILTLEEVTKLFHICLKEMQQLNPKNLTFVMLNTKTREKMGLIGLNWVQSNCDEVEGGIMLKKKFHSKGYAKYAMDILISYAFNELRIKKIIAYCFANNLAANAINKQMGFILESKSQDENKFFFKNKWVLIRKMESGHK